MLHAFTEDAPLVHTGLLNREREVVGRVDWMILRIQIWLRVLDCPQWNQFGGGVGGDGVGNSHHIKTSPLLFTLQ